MTDVVVLGATGFTGRLVCEALERLGTPYALAGRRAASLDALSADLPSRPPRFVVDLSRPETLDAAMSTARAVCNTAGPFLRHGEPVVAAAIRNRIYYVDTTAEQPFQRAVVEKFAGAAQAAGIAVVTAQACDFAPAYLAGHLLSARFGPLTALDSWHWLDDYKVSRGTALSAVGMIGAASTEFRGGREVPMRRQPFAERVRFPFEFQDRYGVPFPGGDTVLLPREIPSLRSATSRLVLPAARAHAFAAFDAASPLLAKALTQRTRARLERLVEDKVDNPDETTRKAASWTVVVRGTGAGGFRWCKIRGSDVYAATGELAARGAARLARDGAKLAGVVSTGAAFDADAFLGELATVGIGTTVYNATGAVLSA